MTRSSSDSSPSWMPRLWLNLSLICQVLSAGFGKQAALVMSEYSAQAILGNVYYFLAMGFLILQAVFWPLALRGYSLTVAYFYMSLSYLGILAISRIFFHEEISVGNLIGTLLIMAGVNLMMLHGAEKKHV